MNTPKYLLAKYVPDLRRGEPRNVGVIVWSPDGVEARFVGEKPGRPGDIDGRSVPSFVTSPAAYRQWVEYWTYQLRREEIAPVNGGVAVGRERVEFLEALRASNKGNFALVDGGFLLDRVEAGSLGDLADHLFRALVETSVVEEAADPSLYDMTQRVLDSTGIQHDPRFKSRYRLSCTIEGGADERFEFDYAFENGSLKRLYQKLALPKRHETQQVRIDATAWKFERVVTAGLLTGDRPVALIYPTEEQLSDPETNRMLSVLGTVGRVLDLHDQDAAEGEFRGLVRLPDHDE